MKKVPLFIPILLLVACQAPSPTPSSTATSTPTLTSTPTPMFTPTPIPPSPDGIVIVPGFAVAVFAEGLGNLTSLAFAPDGRLFVSEAGGKIFILGDRDGDGYAESKAAFAEGLALPLGIAFNPASGELYGSLGSGIIAILPDENRDDLADGLEMILDLPSNGSHRNNGIAFGPDGRLYMTLGSSCNACEERDPLRAAILVANPDGSGLEVYARGLRNVYDIAFNPITGELYGPDNGVDNLGADLPPEELNRIVQGGDYGWPYCYGQNITNPEFPPASSCQGKIPPVAELEPHSSADGLVFYTGHQFPAEYSNNIFLALWGSWPYTTLFPTGHKVVRVVLPGDNSQATVTDFIWGLGNPLDLAVVPDGQPLAGELLVADYGRGKIYRVWAVN